MNLKELTQYIEEHTKAPVYRIDTYKGHNIIKDSDNWRPYLLLAPEFEGLRPRTTRYRTLSAAKAAITRIEPGTTRRKEDLWQR